jgi:hypothetical protein
MAETEIPPLAAIARVGVNRVGEGWAQFPGKNDRSDPTNAPPLYVRFPMERDPAPEPPPKTEPILTEAEARQALADAIEAREAARRRLDDATAAYERGQVHVAKLKREAAAYADLQGAIEDHISNALRLDGHAELPEELRGRLTAREIAATELAAAERVAEQLLRERPAAVDAYRRTEWPVTAALTRVIDYAEAPLRAELQRLTLRVDALRQAIQR